MEKILCLLLFATNLLYAQRNVALLHVPGNASPKARVATAFTAEIPFELAGGMIVVSAILDGQEGNFILDTGAPGIVINATKSGSSKLMNGFSAVGSLCVEEVEVMDFQLGAIHKERTNGYLLDVRHLEAICGMDIMGLIGFDFLKNYELLFDFPNRRIQAFKSGDAEKLMGRQPVASVPFVQIGHLPVVVAKIGNKRLHLGIDSGAEVNLLERSLFEKIDAAQLTNILPELLTGLDNHPQEVVGADLQGISLKQDMSIDQRYVFADMKHLRQDGGPRLDGLLGMPLFMDKTISIDYKRRKIYFWD